MFCKLTLPSNEIHKLSYLPTSYDELLKAIHSKLQGRISSDFLLKYKDSEDELITLSCDDDLKTAIFTLKSEGQNTLRLSIIPKPDTIHNIRHDLNLNSLPGIPEALERSKSTLEEISMVESFAMPSVGKPTDILISPFAKFDIDKIPHVHSMIMDDAESLGGLTPFVERQEPMGPMKKIFTFSRLDAMENTPKPQKEKAITTSQQKVFSVEQIKIIERLIEAKLDQGLQGKVQSLAHELALKFNEEFNNNLSFVSPGRASPSPYKTGVFPKSFNRLGPRRHTMQVIKDIPQETNICAECASNIIDIKFMCLTCQNFTCCETCENQLEHPHPLLKIKPQQAQGNDCELGNTISAPTGNSNAAAALRSANRNATLNPMLLSMNNSEANLPTPGKVMEGHQGIKRAGKPQISLKRGLSMGTIMSSPSPIQPRFGKTPNDCDAKYKGTIHKSSMYDVLNVKLGASYTVHLTVKNSGDNKWCDSIKLVCINGIYKDNTVDLVDLHPGEEKTVVLSLTAPAQTGRYLSQWKLYYFEEGLPRPFGRAVFVDIEVSGKDGSLRELDEENNTSGELFQLRERKQQNESNNSTLQSLKEPDRKLMREMKCSEQVLARAKMLNDMFPGDIKEKVDFIRNFTTNFDINDIVSSYLAKISHASRKRPNWTESQGISTQS